MERHTHDSGLLARWYGPAAVRRRLARDWEAVLSQSRRPASIRRAPLARQRALLASGDIRRLVGVLSGPGPLSPRGVAMARLLLTDGSGPLYAVGPQVDLAPALDAVLRELDPDRLQLTH